MDQEIEAVKSATVSKDKKTVRLKIDALRKGYVHELTCNVRSNQDEPLLHNMAWYTLNQLMSKR